MDHFMDNMSFSRAGLATFDPTPLPPQPYQEREVILPSETHGLSSERFFHDQLARQIWREAALPKVLATTTDHPAVHVEVPPIQTERFLEDLFHDWMSAFTARKIRKELASSTAAERAELKRGHENEVLRSFNKSIRSGANDESWDELSLDQQTSLAVRAFRALISNQPEWIAHVNNLIIARQQTWETFFATTEGEAVLETINRSFGLTQFPTGFIQAQLSRSHLMIKNGALSFEGGGSDDASVLGSEQEVALAEGKEVRQLHEAAFVRAAEQLNGLQRLETRLQEESKKIGDVPQILSWRRAVQLSAERLLEIRIRMKHIETVEHTNTKDRTDVGTSYRALADEKRHREIFMDSLRKIGQIVEGILRMDDSIIPENASLDQLIGALNKKIVHFSKQPFERIEAIPYVD